MINYAFPLLRILDHQLTTFDDTLCIGNINPNTDPSPSLLVTQIFPLCRLMISAEIYNPKPNPDALWPDDSLTR
jgi:hypothetical protein